MAHLGLVKAIWKPGLQRRTGAIAFSAVLSGALGLLCIRKALGQADLDGWIYLAALASASLGCLLAGWCLGRSSAPDTPAGRDLAQARKAAAVALLVAAPWPLLLANSLLTLDRQPEDIGPFDVLTWLGTLATLAVVISGAWVAVYVKRRDDERQHALSLMDMRQRWIDELRSDLAGLLTIAREVQQANETGTPNPEAARRALGLSETVALRLNPVESHHHILFMAVRGLLRTAGVHDQLRGLTTPAPRTPPSTFDAGVEWVRALAQLVLKIEWVVTSLGRDRIKEKVDRQWATLMDFERAYAGELLGIVPQLRALRERHGMLTGGPDAELATEADGIDAPSIETP